MSLDEKIYNEKKEKTKPKPRQHCNQVVCKKNKKEEGLGKKLFSKTGKKEGYQWEGKRLRKGGG